MKLFVRLMVFFIMSAVFSSCQKAVFDEDDGGGGAVDGVAIRFQVTQFEQIPLEAPARVVQRMWGKHAHRSTLPFTKMERG